MAIDDTHNLKLYSRKTEFVSPQYYSEDDIPKKSHTIVVSSWITKDKRFPINLKTYKPACFFPLDKDDPDFKDKHIILQELIIDALMKGIPFSDIVFDNWYFSNKNIKFIEAKDLTWITECDNLRKFLFSGKWIHRDELVKLIPSSKFTRKVALSTKQGKKSTLRLYAFKTKFNGLKGKKLIVVAKGKWDSDDDKDFHVLVTNHLSYTPEEVVRRYTLRWGIEVIFRELKDFLCFDQYQMRYIKGIERHWYLVFLAHTFLILSHLNSSLGKELDGQRLNTFGEMLTAYRVIHSKEQLDWISKNKEQFITYLDRLVSYQPLSNAA